MPQPPSVIQLFHQGYGVMEACMIMVCYNSEMLSEISYPMYNPRSSKGYLSSGYSLYLYIVISVNNSYVDIRLKFMYYIFTS